MQIALRTRLLASVLLATGVACSAASAQTPTQGCTLNKETYTCDWQAFRARFAAVHTVAIEPQPMERFMEQRLRELVQSLGKSVSVPEQPGDVILRIVPVAATGVAFGPADEPLAKLEVLAPGEVGSPATLLWVETFMGQADRPWPTVVTAVTNQFQARFRHSAR